MKIEDKKIEIFLFLLFFVLGILAFVFLNVWEGRVGSYGGTEDYSFPVIADDSPGYYVLGENIIKHGKFTSSQSEPLALETFRTPGYPLFLSIILYLFRYDFFISFFQILLSASSVLLLYKIVSLYFKKSVALLASLLLIVEPSFIYYSNVVLSDSFFVFLLLLSIYYFLLSLKTEKFYYHVLFSSGLILGFAILTRPIGMFLPFIYLSFFILFNLRIFTKKKILAITLFIFGIFIVLAPWSIRNKINFNSFELSSVSGVLLHKYTAPMYYAYKENVSIDEARAFFNSKLEKGVDVNDKSLLTSDEYRKASLPYLKENFWGYSKYHLVKTMPFFLTDGVRDILYQIKLNSSGFNNISSLILKGEFKKVFVALSDFNLYNFFLIFGAFFWLMINIFAFLSIIFILKNKNKEKIFIALFFFILIMYFAFTTGPVSNSRYRLPAEPFMFTLFSLGFLYAFDLVKELYKKYR